MYRRRIARTLNAPYAGGLLSEDTFVARLDELLRSRLIDPRRLVGDLNLRQAKDRWRQRIRAAFRRLLRWLEAADFEAPAPVLLALDWTGASGELLIGRHPSSDVVLSNRSVSRRHARLVFRDDKWIVQDLRSTNGTTVNGTRVGRCELRPGDHLLLGDELLRID